MQEWEFIFIAANLDGIFESFLWQQLIHHRGFLFSTLVEAAWLQGAALEQRRSSPLIADDTHGPASLLMLPPDTWSNQFPQLSLKRLLGCSSVNSGQLISPGPCQVNCPGVVIYRLPTVILCIFSRMFFFPTSRHFHCLLGSFETPPPQTLRLNKERPWLRIEDQYIFTTGS